MKETWENIRVERIVPSGRIVRFGAFEVALDAEELHKNGVKIRLPAQPFRILTLLLEHPGQVVTREVLRRELWPADTFVDFDRCLNTAVNRLREALGDSAENPRYIQTLPRRGYRFLAPVEKSEQVVQAAEAWAESLTPGGLPAAAPRRKRWMIWAAAGVVVALAVIMMVWSPWRSKPRPPGPLSIVTFTGFPGTETTPSLSSDGRQVVFSWGGDEHDNYDIYVQEVGSDKPRRLTTSPAEDFAPSFSPDGSKIAFYRRSGDSAAVYLIPSSGGRAVRLLGLKLGPPGPSAASPGDWSPELLAWSPDGRSLAFVDKRSPANAFSIWVRRIGAKEEQRLTRPPGGSPGDGSPAFSPDGRTLAFVRRTNSFVGDIYLVPLAGGRPTRVTADNRAIRGLAWTSDGRDIVFSSARGGQFSLWRISASGGAPERLAGVGEYAIFPTISVRGSRLAYVRLARDTNIWRIRLGASSGREFAPSRFIAFSGEMGTPRFAQDGKRIAFASNQSGYWEIWTCDAHGSNPVRLTYMQSYAASPRYSPDSRYIAFDSREAGNWDVFVVGAEGGAPRRLTTDVSEDVRPSWSSDGEWIYFGSDRSGAFQVWKLPSVGGSAVQVTTNGGYEAVESSDGRFVYYTRHGVPGLWRVPTDGGEETLMLEDLQWEASRNWNITKKGVYFLAWEGTLPSKRTFVVKFLDFGTRRVEQVAVLGKARLADMGCSISPNLRWLLYVQHDEAQTDISLVENFR